MRKPISEETRKKMSNSHKGKKLTREHKKNIGDSKRKKDGLKKFQGYVYVYCPEYPIKSRDRYVKRTNLVWFKETGEIIIKPHILHHKDGDRVNDDIKNLQKLTISEHMKLEHTKRDYCKVRGVKMREKTKDKISKGVKRNLPKTIFKKGHTPWNKKNG